MSQHHSLAELGIRLTALDIHQKDFKTAFRGYDPDQINEYLDEVIKDYQVFEDIVEKLELEIKQLKKKLAEQQRQPERSERVPQHAFDRSMERIMEQPLDKPLDLVFERPIERMKERSADRPQERQQIELIDRVRELEKFCFGRARD